MTNGTRVGCFGKMAPGDDGIDGCDQFRDPVTKTVGDRHELAARITLVPWEVCELRPCAGTKNTDAHSPRWPPMRGSHWITTDVSPGSNSCRCAQIGAMPFVMNRSWNSRSENLGPIRF